MVTAASDLAIETTGIVKAFGTTRAVDGINLSVKKGSVHGFLGPNGAGKTTMLKLLATLRRPDEGEARVLGHDLVKEADAVRSRVSLTGQFASLDEDLTGFENLSLLARLLGYSGTQARTRAYELLDAYDLREAAGRPVKTYSGGMRRRLDISASLVVTPEILFLDEPTTGLDPRSRYQVWTMVRELIAEGTTVLLTTQYLDEADQLADRISVIDHGRVIAEGTPGELKASVNSNVVQVRLMDADQRPQAEGVLTAALQVPVGLEADPFSLTAHVSDVKRVAVAFSELSEHGIRIADFSFGQATLDEVFLAITGHSSQGATTTASEDSK